MSAQGRLQRNRQRKRVEITHFSQEDTMAVKVGINGFGRIGRQVLKAIRDYYPEKLEVVAFNDIGDLKTMAHMLKYDSNYGRFDGDVQLGDNALLIDGK